jgi:hypothetical protein
MNSNPVMTSNGATEQNISHNKRKFSKRYNKLVLIDLEKRAILRNLVKQNTQCEHKQIYTQANAICRRISSSYEEGRISAENALKLMLDAHDKMSHKRLPKDVVADEMNKRLNKLEKGEKTAFEITMANVSYANNLRNERVNDKHGDEYSNKYSESYWAEVI